jgi:hypothetical protein
MRSALLAPLGTLLAGAGLALAQAPSAPAPAAPPSVLQAPAAPKDGAPKAGGEASGRETVIEFKPGDKVPVVTGHEGEEHGPGGMPPAPVSSGPFFGDVDCERDYDVWVGAEYLLWYAKKGPLAVPLLTTGPNGSLGILGAQGVTPVVGTSEIDYHDQHGARMTAGVGVPGLGAGLEFTGFFLGKQNQSFVTGSDSTGVPTLARPVINSNTGMETSSLIASPGAFTGSVQVEAFNQMWGGEANIVRGRVATPHLFADLILGFRYIGLEEGLSISQQSTLLPGGTSGFNGDIVSAPATLGIIDRFQTRNQFYGGQVGFQGEIQYAGFFLYGMGKIAIGSNNESIRIEGFSTRTTPGAGSEVVNGGLLALAGNRGTTSRNAFTYIPEVNVSVGYQFGTHLRAYFGYNFIYWDDTVRPGAQLDRRVNPTQVPTSLSFSAATVGAPAPLPAAHHSTYYVGGIAAGMVFRY